MNQQFQRISFYSSYYHLGTSLPLVLPTSPTKQINIIASTGYDSIVIEQFIWEAVKFSLMLLVI